MYEGDEKCIKGFGGKTQWNETLRRNRRMIILKLTLKK
jgi:hypothetical protein